MSKLKRKPKPSLGSDLTEEETLDSVQKEMESVLQDEKLDIANNGLRIVGVQKVYRKLPFGLISPRDVYAVRGIYL